MQSQLLIALFLVCAVQVIGNPVRYLYVVTVDCSSSEVTMTQLPDVDREIYPLPQKRSQHSGHNSGGGALHGVKLAGNRVPVCRYPVRGC
jgi:hypothetical protein